MQQATGKSSEGGETKPGLTVFTPFGADRPWLVDLWLQHVRQAELPAGTRFVVVDNTGDPSVPDRLRRGLGKTAAILRHPPLVQRGVEALIAHLVSVWNLAKPTFSGQVLSWESDVAVDPAALARLIHGHRDLCQRAGLVGTPIICRPSKPHAMVFRLVSLTPFRIGAIAPRHRQGLLRVGHVSCGLLLMREDVARMPISGAPDAGPESLRGVDFSLMARAQRAGAEVWCDWTIRPRHYLTPNTYRVWDSWTNPAGLELTDPATAEAWL